MDLGTCEKQNDPWCVYSATYACSWEFSNIGRVTTHMSESNKCDDKR